MRNFAKKAISLLCVLSMLFSMVITSSAQQVETTISVENQTIEQGSGTEEVEVPIKIANNTGILGMKLSVTFDDELTLVNAVKGTALSSLTFSKSKEFTDVPFNLVWDGEASADTNNGVIATLTFEVPKGTAKDYEINIAASGVYDDNVNPLYPTTVNGKISVNGGGHTHSFGKWEKISDSQHQRKCGCGETETESHNTDGVVAHKDATCTEDGVVGGNYCTVCNNGKAEAEEVITAPGHNTDGVVTHKDATCTEDGVVGGNYCTVCNNGKAEAEATIDKLGHNTDGVVAHKEATCTEDGVVGGNYCTVCNNGKTEAEATIDKLGHNTDGVVAHKDATCTEDGVVGGNYCTRCNNGKADAEEVITAPGHNTDGVVAHKEATCTEDGVVGGNYCTRCNNGKAEAEEVITAPGHNTDGVVAHKEATCTEDGVVGGTYCTRCNNGKAEAEATIDKLGHNTDGFVAHKDATCTEDGVVGGNYCTRCNNGKTEAEATIDKLGHNFIGDYVEAASGHYRKCINANCTEKGLDGVKDKTEAHDYTNDDDESCNDCGFTRVLTYTVTLVANDGTVGTSLTSYNYGTTTTLPTDCTKTGFNFVGWYDNEGLSGEAVTSILATAKGNKTYYAKWTINQYTITFDTDGGSEIAPITQDYNSAVTTPENPTKSGYNFVKWVDSEGNEITVPTTMPAEDITLKAIWKRRSSGGGSSSTTTTTTKNDDGSKTTTTTNKVTGTVTETTTNPDGSSIKVETKKDGTITTIEKDKDGNTSTTVEKRDGTSTTTEKNKNGSEKVTEKSADGTTVTTEKDTDGTKTVTTENADGSTSTEEVRKDGTEVKTETTTDGETTAEVKADGKAEVTIPVPDTEKVQMVVVTDESGNNTYITEVETNDNGVAVTTDGNATVSVISGNKKEFADVHHVEHWSEKSVDFVHILGLMNGTSENHFSPDVQLTRAMLVTVLYRAEGEPEITNDNSFVDVENGSYYEKAVAWAKTNGIVNGTSATTFDPNVSITREQIAAIIHRYADFKGHDVQVGENTNILSYDDVHHVSEYAIGAMQYAVGSGLIKGKTESTLNPLDNATRAEVAAILERFIKAN